MPEQESEVTLEQVMLESNSLLRDIKNRVTNLESSNIEPDPAQVEKLELERPAKVKDIKTALQESREAERNARLAEEKAQRDIEKGNEYFNNFSESLKAEAEAAGAEFDRDVIMDLAQTAIAKAQAAAAGKGDSSFDVDAVFKDVANKYRKLARIQSVENKRDSVDLDKPFTNVADNIDVAGLSNSNTKVKAMLEEAKQQMKDTGRITPALRKRIYQVRDKIHSTVNNPEKFSKEQLGEFYSQVDKNY